MSDAFYTATEIDALLKPINAALAKLQADVKALQQPAPPPGPPGAPQSPDGTKITPGAGSILDANGDTWTIEAQPGIHIWKNGAAPAPNWAWQTNEAVFHQRQVVLRGLDGNWYAWTGSAFAPTTKPPGA